MSYPTISKNPTVGWLVTIVSSGMCVDGRFLGEYTVGMEAPTVC